MSDYHGNRILYRNFSRSEQTLDTKNQAVLSPVKRGIIVKKERASDQNTKLQNTSKPSAMLAPTQDHSRMVIKTRTREEVTCASFLDLPDELLLLIAEQTVQHGLITIRVRSRRHHLELGKKQPSIYHLSMVTRRLRNICSEFIYRRIQFSLQGELTASMITDLEYKFHRRQDAFSFFRCISFTTTSPLEERQSGNIIHLFTLLVLDMIRMCTQLRRMFLPDFCSWNQSQDTMKLLEAVNNHPSSDLLLVYTKMQDFRPFRNPGPFLSVPLSKVSLLSLNTSNYHGHTPRYLEPLLKQGLRVQKLERGLHWESLEWFEWTRLTYPDLRVVSGWPLFQSTEIQHFIRRHPLLEKIEVTAEREMPRTLSTCWLTAIPGVSKLLDTFPFRKGSHYCLLYSFTIVRRNDTWKLEEVYVFYYCSWQEEDLVPMANNLKSTLPPQIRRLGITRPCIRSEGYITSLLAARGLEVRWRS